MASREKIPLTLCVIAQNEESNLPACLRSADFAAEMLVVDGGSTDRSAEIAAELGARVEERPFDGMGPQKNAGLEMASQDWVLSLDADERVSPELREEILALFRDGEPSEQGYTMPRRAWHLGRWIHGGGWYPDRKLRLFRATAGRWAGREPHNSFQLEGRVGELQGDLLHYPYRDLAHHVAKMDRYTSAAAEVALAEGRRFPLLRMLLSPPLRFGKSYFLRGGFRDGGAGFVLAVMAAVYECVRYAKLWDLQRQRSAKS